MSEIKVVKMQKEHIPALVELEKECFSDPWSQKALEEELSNPNAVFVVATKNDEVAGYVGMLHILDEGDICNVAVFKKFRRNGVATALLENLLEYAEENKFSFITLEVRESNEAAQIFYEKMGFQKMAVRRNFYENPKEDAYIMTKILEN